jgi:hypothetical protein
VEGYGGVVAQSTFGQSWEILDNSLAPVSLGKFSWCVCRGEGESGKGGVEGKCVRVCIYVCARMCVSACMYVCVCVCMCVRSCASVCPVF